MNAFAVFDPNYGDPVPLLKTVRETADEAVEAAIQITDNVCALYSGASSYSIGSWSKMEQHGYRVRPITIEVLS